MDAREAWRRKYAARPRPWTGPVHAAPLLDGLPGRVVELGAGGGKVDAALSREALALDWIREALPPGRPAVVADVARLPFADASVDALVAVHVLGHLDAAGRAAAGREWGRVLRPGGVLVVEVFARGDARDGAGRPVEPRTFEREGIPTHYFDAGELAALLPRFEGAWALASRRLPWGERRVLRARLTSR